MNRLQVRLVHTRYEEVEKWPEYISAATGVTNEGKKLVEQALGSSALVLVEPSYVDWV